MLLYGILLLGIGLLMVIATTLKFISAQSPQSMKGLLLGVFFVSFNSLSVIVMWMMQQLMTILTKALMTNFIMLTYYTETHTVELFKIFMFSMH